MPSSLRFAQGRLFETRRCRGAPHDEGFGVSTHAPPGPATLILSRVRKPASRRTRGIVEAAPPPSATRSTGAGSRVTPGTK
jgi:hypothetical protein